MQIKNYLLILILSFSLVSKSVDIPEWLKENKNEIGTYAKSFVLGAVVRYFASESFNKNSDTARIANGLAIILTAYNALDIWNSNANISCRKLVMFVLGAFAYQKMAFG